MPPVIIDLDQSDNTQEPEKRYPKGQKFKFKNACGIEITLTTPKGLKRKKKKDKKRETPLAVGETSDRFKITADPDEDLEYSWTWIGIDDPKGMDVRAGRIRVS